jgi:hypothetical protein
LEKRSWNWMIESLRKSLYCTRAVSAEAHSPLVGVEPPPPSP